MSFNYTTGNPDNLVGGNSAAMADIQGPFYDIRAYLNSGALETLARGLLIIGEVRFIGVVAAPALWLPCDGAAVPRGTYSALFTAIGTAWGAGDGTTTFNVPDLRGRVAVGSGTGKANDGVTNLTTRTIGTKWGVEAVVLTVPQLPSHGHGVGSIATSAGGLHSHTIGPDPVLAPGTYVLPYSNQVIDWQTQGVSTNVHNPASNFPWGGTDGNHTHHASSDGSHVHGMSGATANAGTDGGHDNTMPATAIPAYIYAGA